MPVSMMRIFCKLNIVIIFLMSTLSIKKSKKIISLENIMENNKHENNGEHNINKNTIFILYRENYLI
jgi:hypothetical protein